MPLTDITIRTAKGAEKRQRLNDGAGLYLEISPAGGKWWRFKYRFDGSEKRLSLGVYPDVGLKNAKERRDELRRLLASGVDPGVHRKVQSAARVQRATDSFEAIGREWFAKFSSTKWVKSHADKSIRRLEVDVFPWLGSKPIAEIIAPDVLAALRRIEGGGTLDTAHRARGNCSQICRYAIATGRAERDPVPDLRGALPPLNKAARFAAAGEALEIATDAGMTGWQALEGKHALRRCFSAWLERYGLGNREDEQIISQAEGWFARHSYSHFIDWEAAGVVRVQPISMRDVAGYCQNKGDDSWYHVFPTAFIEEIAEGYDRVAAANVLERVGMLQKNGDGKATTPTRTPDNQEPRRFYRFVRSTRME